MNAKDQKRRKDINKIRVKKAMLREYNSYAASIHRDEMHIIEHLQRQ